MQRRLRQLIRRPVDLLMLVIRREMNMIFYLPSTALDPKRLWSLALPREPQVGETPVIEVPELSG